MFGECFDWFPVKFIKFILFEQIFIWFKDTYFESNKLYLFQKNYFFESKKVFQTNNFLWFNQIFFLSVDHKQTILYILTFFSYLVQFSLQIRFFISNVIFSNFNEDLILHQIFARYWTNVEENCSNQKDLQISFLLFVP